MKKKQAKEVIEESKQTNEKSATDNQWTNNNLKYYPDDRPEQDGPGGN